MGFENVTTSEFSTLLLFLLGVIWLAVFFVPAVLIAAIFNSVRKVDKTYRRRSYSKLVVANTLLFIAWVIFAYATWNMPTPDFAIFIPLWLLVQFLTLKNLSTNPHSNGSTNSLGPRR